MKVKQTLASACLSLSFVLQAGEQASVFKDPTQQFQYLAAGTTIAAHKDVIIKPHRYSAKMKTNSISNSCEIECSLGVSDIDARLNKEIPLLIKAGNFTLSDGVADFSSTYNMVTYRLDNDLLDFDVRYTNDGCPDIREITLAEVEKFCQVTITPTQPQIFGEAIPSTIDCQE